MTVLLSIKPEFAEKIFSGVKKYEYRKSIFKRQDVKRVIVYSSSPQKKVIGEFSIDKIIKDDITSLWEHTHLYSGISEDYYRSYFKNKIQGYAIKIGKVKRYSKAKRLSDFNIAIAPQSFIYLNE